MAKATKTTDKAAAEPEVVSAPKVEETPKVETSPKEDFVEPSSDVPVETLTEDELLQKEIKALRLLQDEIVWQQFNWGKTPELREPVATMLDYMDNHIAHARKALDKGDEKTAYTRIRILAGVAFGVLQREEVPPREK